MQAHATGGRVLYWGLLAAVVSAGIYGMCNGGWSPGTPAPLEGVYKYTAHTAMKA